MADYTLMSHFTDPRHPSSALQRGRGGLANTAATADAASKKERLDPFEVGVNMQTVSFTGGPQMNICNYLHRRISDLQPFGNEWKENEFTLSVSQ